MARTRLEEMERGLEREADNIASLYDPEQEQLQTLVLRPKKKDMAVRWSGLFWLPFWHLESGEVKPGFGLD